MSSSIISAPAKSPTNEDRLEVREGLFSITKISALRQDNHRVKDIPLKEARSILLSADRVVESITSVSGKIGVGDVIVKVNNTTIGTAQAALKEFATATEPLAIRLTRRFYASIAKVPQAQPGFAYHLITCKKNTNEQLVTNTFGITAAMMEKKWYTLQIASNSAAERFLAIGDVLIEVDGKSFQGDKIALLNELYQNAGSVAILVERPVSMAALALVEGRVKEYLRREMLRQIDFPMGDDAIQIGLKAAQNHQEVLRFMKPTSILVQTKTPRKKPSKEGKKLEKKKDSMDEEAVQLQSESRKPTTFKSPLVKTLTIRSDVPPDTELTQIEKRFGEEESEADDNEESAKEQQAASKVNMI